MAKQNLHAVKKPIFQAVLDLAALPLRFLLSNDFVDQTPFTSLRAERIQAVLNHAQGYLLDVGCGDGNLLVKMWGRGVGVDVYPWPGCDIICDTRAFPFKGLH